MFEMSEILWYIKMVLYLEKNVERGKEFLAMGNEFLALGKKVLWKRNSYGQVFWADEPDLREGITR